MSRPSAGPVWTMLLLPPVTLGALIVAYMALTGVGPADPDAEAVVRRALPGIIAVNHLALLGLLIHFLRRRGASLADAGWRLAGGRGTRGREVGVGLACGLGLYLFKELGVDPVRQLLDGVRPTFTSLFRFRIASLDPGMALVATTLVFVEETIYRGYALPFFRARWGVVPAVLLTSGAFGLLHWGNGAAAVAITSVYGVLLAAVFLWRRNLVAGTAAHALYNLLVLLT